MDQRHIPALLTRISVWLYLFLASSNSLAIPASVDTSAPTRNCTLTSSHNLADHLIRTLLAGHVVTPTKRLRPAACYILRGPRPDVVYSVCLEQLALGQAKLMEFDLIQVGPLTPLAMLLNDKPAGK